MDAFFRSLCFVASLGGSGWAQADLVSVLPGSPVAPPATAAFSNTNVTLGTLSTVGSITYNFLDTWTFALAADAQVGSITTTFDFGATSSGTPPTFGISNLQVRLGTTPPTSPSLVSWLNVTPAGPGVTSSVALIPITPLLAGNYQLQVRGTMGPSGAYGGSVIVSAVPLPAALPLFLAGLGALGVNAARRPVRVLKA